MSKYKVKYEPKSVVSVTLDISDDEINAAYSKALKKTAGRIQMPGFRKGKAPEAMVESYVGKEKIYEDALNTLIPEEFEKALKEDQKESKKRIMLLNYPSFKLEKEWKPGEDLTVAAQSVMYPQFEIDKLASQLRVKKANPESVSAEEIDESIAKIFDQYKKIKSEENKRTATGTEPKAGEDNSEQKTESMSVEVSMDDEFAKAAGMPTLEELRKAIESELSYDKTSKVERDFEEAVVKNALDLVEIDIPDLLVDEELNRIEQRFTSQLSRIGTTLDNYLTTENKTLEDLRKEWIVRAQENTKLALILQELRVKEQIPVSDEEVKLLATQNGIKGAPNNDQYATLSYIIGQSKALEKLKTIAQQ